MVAAKSFRRIIQELNSIKDGLIHGITVTVENDNAYEWKCVIYAARDSPYFGGKFKLDISLPEDYPFKAPTAKLETQIYHPGINEEGSICVSILREDWKPTISMSTVLSVIQEKLNNPSPDDPFRPDIAALLMNDRPKFLQIAKEWTKKYASSSQPSMPATSDQPHVEL